MYWVTFAQECELYNLMTIIIAIHFGEWLPSWLVVVLGDKMSLLLLQC